jgi:hypothetical protein
MSDLDRLLQQWLTFDQVTLTCDRCLEEAPLLRCQPSFDGLVCVRCVREIPYDELEALRQAEQTP